MARADGGHKLDLGQELDAGQDDKMPGRSCIAGRMTGWQAPYLQQTDLTLDGL